MPHGDVSTTIPAGTTSKSHLFSEESQHVPTGNIVVGIAESFDMISLANLVSKLSVVRRMVLLWEEMGLLYALDFGLESKLDLIICQSTKWVLPAKLSRNICVLSLLVGVPGSSPRAHALSFIKPSMSRTLRDVGNVGEMPRSWRAS